MGCDDLSVGYRDEVVLSGLSFTVQGGTTVAIMGRSGCGKTTLLKTFAGILAPIGGDAWILDATLPNTPAPGTLGYIPQNLGLVESTTVKRNVLHGTLADLGWIRSLFGRFPPAADEAATNAIERVGLAGEEHRRVSALSGGQRRRVAIARALVQGPQVLLADEILSELDAETAASIVELIDSLQVDTGLTVLMVEHNPKHATTLADRVVHIEEGSLRVGEESSVPSTDEDGVSP